LSEDLGFTGGAGSPNRASPPRPPISSTTTSSSSSTASAPAPGEPHPYQASLAIENNTLTLEKVTAVIEGERVLGHPREIQEVRNAFATYEAMEDWDAIVEEDLLAAHDLLMRGLVDETGRYRFGGVGIFRGEQLVHMAPPADRVPKLMADQLGWLVTTREHPLVTSCLLHYEFEFIHPFADGNGRMGRITAKSAGLKGNFRPVILSAKRQLSVAWLESTLLSVMANLLFTLCGASPDHMEGKGKGAFQGGDGLGEIPGVHLYGDFRNRNRGGGCHGEQVFNEIPRILPERSGIGLPVTEGNSRSRRRLTAL
jgi:hypothetical protein